MIHDSREFNEAHGYCSTISWAAVFSGALIAIGLSFLLNLFSVAIGLHVFNFNQDNTGITAGGFIGFIIGLIVTMLIAGYAAGYLGRLHCPQRTRGVGVIYGFLTWTVALILSAMITAHLSSAVTQYAASTPNSFPALSVGSNANNATTNKAGVKTTTTNTTNTSATSANVSVPSGFLAWSAFTLFILFFIGALSACIGGCLGMNYNCPYNPKDTR